MNHHYNPQFYLKRWKDPVDGKVNHYYYCDSARLVCGKRGTRYLGCAEGLYEIYGVNEQAKDFLETDHYKLLDDKASRVVQKLIETGVSSLNQVDRQSWADFLFSMMIRHPMQVRKAAKDGKLLINELRESMSEADKGKYAKENDFFEKNIGNLTIAGLSGYGGFEQQEPRLCFIETFLNLYWWIDNYSSLDFGLITCDKPVIIYRVSDKYDHHFNGTMSSLLQECDCILSIPISPIHCFFAYRNKRPNNNYSQVLKTQNFNIIASADKSIYTKDLCNDKFIRKYFKYKSEPN